MTVLELIAALKAFPPEMEVMVNGGEWGVSPIKTPEKIKIMRNYWKDMDATTCGQHGEVITREDPWDDEVVHIGDDIDSDP